MSNPLSPSADIIYNPVTGVFTINRPGNYYVAWQINTDGAQAGSTVKFTLDVAGGPKIPCCSLVPSTSLELAGNAFLNITQAPTTFSLINDSNNTVSFGETDIQANLTIIGIPGEPVRPEPPGM